MKEANVNPKAYHLADAHLTRKLLDLVRQTYKLQAALEKSQGSHQNPQQKHRWVDCEGSRRWVLGDHPAPLSAVWRQKWPLRFCVLQLGFRMGLWSLQASRRLFCYHQGRRSTKTADPVHSALYWKALGVGCGLCPSLLLLPLLDEWGFLVEPYDTRVGSPYPLPPTMWVRCILHMKKAIAFSLLSILINMFIFRFKWKKRGW